MTSFLCWSFRAKWKETCATSTHCVYRCGQMVTSYLQFRLRRWKTNSINTVRTHTTDIEMRMSFWNLSRIASHCCGTRTHRRQPATSNTLLPLMPSIACDIYECLCNSIYCYICHGCFSFSLTIWLCIKFSGFNKDDTHEFVNFNRIMVDWMRNGSLFFVYHKWICFRN